MDAQWLMLPHSFRAKLVLSSDQVIEVQQDLPAGCQLVTFPVHGDQRGSLIALESATGIPFDIARAYFIYGTQPGLSRGFHAHRKLHELVMCVSGSCTIVVDDGQKKATVHLDRPDLAVQIGTMVWREMHDFSRDCVLLVLAAAPYDPADYIRDYEAFVAEVAARR